MYAHQSDHSTVCSNVHKSRSAISRTSTVREEFPGLFSQDLNLLKLERKVGGNFEVFDAAEKETFSSFWSEVLSNHKSQRRRQRRRVVMVTMACIVGAIVGVTG